MNVIQTALDERLKQLPLVVSTFEERGIYICFVFFFQTHFTKVVLR